MSETIRNILLATAQGLITAGTFTVLCEIGRRGAGWKLHMSRSHRIILLLLCMMQAAVIAWLPKEYPPVTYGLLSVLAGCLLAACAMDLQEHAVYRFVWAVAGSAAGLLLLSQKGSFPGVGGLLLYCGVQYFGFGRMYGRADCHAFCVCAAVQAAMGKGFQEYLTHMAATFLGLALVQAVRKNITAGGRLKTPVPLLPYITAAFWLCDLQILPIYVIDDKTFISAIKNFTNLLTVLISRYTIDLSKF